MCVFSIGQAPEFRRLKMLFSKNNNLAVPRATIIIVHENGSKRNHPPSFPDVSAGNPEVVVFSTLLGPRLRGDDVDFFQMSKWARKPHI